MSVQKGREEREEKRGASDCVTRSLLLLLFHSWAFTEGKTRIEDPPRTSGILMKFLPLPSAKRKGEREGEESLFLLKTIHREGFDSIGRLYSSMNRGRGK